MNSPAISIVTPSLNQASFLQESLESVEVQKIDSTQHIIVDGGSTDGSVALLEEFAKGCCYDFRWSSGTDNGQSDALNKGFRQAEGEIVGWLNADDRYRPEAFTAVLDAFQRHPEVDVIYGDYLWIDVNGSVLQQRREIHFSPFVLLYHRVLFIQTTAMFFRRRILEDGHLLDETLQYAMDFEFFVRLSAAGYRFLHLPMFLGEFRFQPHSKTSLHPQNQLRETTTVMRSYSPLLRHYGTGRLAGPLTHGLRALAGVRRYCEKTLRGHYLTQFRSEAPAE